MLGIARGGPGDAHRFDTFDVPCAPEQPILDGLGSTA